MTFKILKVNHYQQLTKVLPTKLTIRPGLTERYMKRSIYNRINYGEDIEEASLRESDGNLTLLYKKTDG